ncbi:hypothetical protein M3Y99_00611700 [Aphelenchoides fujianensis]|nr:hypothetical protein M3Y99_00611700 [Aphelenchoides fujianensis]
MPLIVISGFPASGKSTIAQRLADGFAERSVVIVDDSKVNSEFRRDASHFLDKRKQVDHMNSLRSEIRRILSLNKETIVIVDSLNYARSQRYEMSTIANNCRTTFGIVWVHASRRTALWLNEQRGADGYEAAIMEDLFARYEQPKAHLSGEKPLFEVRIGRAEFDEEGGEPRDVPLPMDEIVDWFVGGKRDVRAKMAVAPHQKASCSSVYEINACTQRIVKQIVEQQNGVGMGGELVLEDGHPLQGEEDAHVRQPQPTSRPLPGHGPQRTGRAGREDQPLLRGVPRLRSPSSEFRLFFVSFVVPVTGPSQPKNVHMFEADRELILPATPSFMLNNLSVVYFEPKFTTYACYCSKNLVQLVSWDMNMENVSMDSLPLKESGKDKPLTVMQCRICLPSNRTLPVLVVATVLNVMVRAIHRCSLNNHLNSGVRCEELEDPRKHADRQRESSSTDVFTRPCLQQDDGRESPIEKKGYKFARGITCVDNYIVIGTYTGDLLIFSCTGEASFNVKGSGNEHKAPIADLATCIYDLITLSADTSGHVVVWAKNMKTVMKRISTGQQISVVNILRKQAFCGNYFGQVHVYSIQSGAQLAELNVHARQITAISVAPESAYVMTASEGLLHSRIEYRYCERTDDNIVVGAQFLNGRGSGYVISQFEYNKLPIFVIRRPAQS